jgi:hypothetical protein
MSSPAVEITRSISVLAGQEVVATVEGEVEVSTGENTSYEEEFSGSNSIEIVKPGRK